MLGILSNWLYNNKDKVFHFLAGMAIFMITSLIFNYLISHIVVIIAAIGKEIHDKKKYNDFDIVDALFTFAGGLVIWFYVYIQILIYFYCA